MVRLVRCLLALAALVTIPTLSARAAEPVDLLLVLSSDVSRSVDHPKFLLQREGYAAAISDPLVMDAINPARISASPSASSNGRASARRSLSSIGP